MPRKRKPAVPESVTNDEALSSTALACVLVIMQNADRAGWVWLSHQEIADRIHKSTSTVSRMMTTLKARGHLEVERPRGDKGRYDIARYRIRGQP